MPILGDFTIVKTLLKLLVGLTVAVFVPRLGAQPVITQQPTNQTVVGGSSVLFSVSVSGSGPFTYRWRFNSNNVPPVSVITTVAGNGTNYFYGDGGAATNAGLDRPKGVTADAKGNLFITDFGHSRIRKVNTNGVIITVAGNGTASFYGDGGGATNAALDLGYGGVAVDSIGNFFIPDTWNSRIRKVDTNAVITTVVGIGGIYRGDGGAATNAGIYDPNGVVLDAKGKMFIADSQNNRIRMVDTNGIITTVAGNGAQGYSGDSGAATNAMLNYPVSVAVDSRGNLFLADYSGHVRMVNTNGIITTLLGNGAPSFSGDGGAATNAGVNNPDYLAIDSVDNLFFVDQGNYRVRRVDTNGIITTVVGNGTIYFSGDGGAATDAGLDRMDGLAVDSGGSLFLSQFYANRIRKVTYSYPQSLILSNVSNNNAGTYSVIITNSSGSVTSSVVTLTVVPVIITQQPQSQTFPPSSNVTFTVAASGTTPMAYQWYFSSANSTTVAGAIAQTLSGFVYGVIVTNSGSGYITAPQVQFVGGGGSGAGGTTSVSNGMVTAITVTNAGTGYTNPPIVVIDPPTGLIIGKTNATLTLNAITTNNSGNYFVIISNVYGSVTSSVAGLTVAATSAPSLPQQPVNQSASPGSNVSFTITATGTQPLNYQWWMVSGTRSNATAVPVVINGFVLAANVTSGGAGYLAVPNVQIVGGSGSGAGGYAVVSNRLVSSITMTNAGSGYSTPPTIQIDAPSAISLLGQTNATLTLLAVTNGNAANYFVVVTNNFGSVTSAFAALTVFLPPQSFLARGSTNHQVALQLTGTPNYPYILQSATNLTPPIIWQPVLTNPADGNGNWQFTETNLNGNQKFYRAVGQ